jgi:glycosyltransferase involved in cell wall biosynthesis
VAAIPPGLDEAYLRLVRTPQNRKAIGFCGTWLPKKGIELLCADMPAVLRRHREWMLTLIGVGDGWRVEDWFPDDVRAQIEVVPFVHDKQQLARLFGRIDILVLPSMYESFGLALAEAMASGCAVAATQVGFACALGKGEHYLSIDPRPGGLSACVETLIADAALRASVAAAGQARARSLTWSRAGEAYRAALKEWLACHSPKVRA